MKAFSNLVIALGFVAASGAALAGDRYEPTVDTSGSTLTRAEVRAEAIASRAQAVLTESGNSIQPTPVAASNVSRAEVRMAALTAGGNSFIDSAY